MGDLCPILSDSFPEGIRNNMLAIPLTPKRRAIKDTVRRRLCSAYMAKSVMKKAFVKEKVKRRYVRISMFREEKMALNDRIRFRLVFS